MEFKCKQKYQFVNLKFVFLTCRFDLVTPNSGFTFPDLETIRK